MTMIVNEEVMTAACPRAWMMRIVTDIDMKIVPGGISSRKLRNGRKYVLMMTRSIYEL